VRVLLAAGFWLSDRSTSGTARRYGFRPTPPNASVSAGGLSPLAGSGRQRGHDTTPGSTSSSPVKKAAIGSGLRSRLGLAADPAEGVQLLGLVTAGGVGPPARD
jgi:hypothetical protein